MYNQAWLTGGTGVVNKTGGGDGVQRRDDNCDVARISPFQSLFSETIHRHVGGGKQKKVLSIKNVLININFDNRDYLLISLFVCCTCVMKWKKWSKRMKPSRGK